MILNILSFSFFNMLGSAQTLYRISINYLSISERSFAEGWHCQSVKRNENNICISPVVKTSMSCLSLSVISVVSLIIDCAFFQVCFPTVRLDASA